MFKLEQIQPWVSLVDSRCGTHICILSTCLLPCGNYAVVCRGNKGEDVTIEISKEDAQFLSPAPSLALDVCDPNALRGCLLGGAIGDALGAAVEFLDWPSIQHYFGSAGIIDFVEVTYPKGAISDDTQLMLFVTEGILRANIQLTSLDEQRCLVHNSLFCWMLTQKERVFVKFEKNSSLLSEPKLWARRSPGMFHLKALKESLTLGARVNNKNCFSDGIVSGVACAFFPDSFERAVSIAQLTHGHPDAYLSAGVFSDILSRLWKSKIMLSVAIHESLEEHKHLSGMEPIYNLINSILSKYESDESPPTPQQLDNLGTGWNAAEALAIGLWCALTARTFSEGVLMAVNHSGDSDATGLITGHILGLMMGVSGIPSNFLENLEGRDLVEKIALDLMQVQWLIK